MPNYERLAKSTAATLARFGAPAVLERVVVGEYDTTQGAPDEDSTQLYNTVAVRTAYKQSEVDGTSVLATDVKLLISPTIATPPQTGDVIVLDGERYTVVSVRAEKPASILLLYTVQARNA